MNIETTMTRAAEEGSGDLFARERRALSDLLEPLHDVPDFSRAEQRAAAFVVDDLKRGEPATWERAVEALRDELRTAHEHEGVPGVTWRLAREVHDRYLAWLARCLEDEHDEVRRGNLEVLQQGIERDLSTRREAYEAGRRVPVGSVILEHVPQWFPQPSE